jgi:hypothetical protein
MSGQIYKSLNQKLSPIFEIIVNSELQLASPRIIFMEPVPPAKTVIK